MNGRELKPIRRKLRNNPTDPEIRFWEHIRMRQIHGLKFRRQCSVGRYVVDFYCFARKLAIEIDGDSHFTEQGMWYDARRTHFLEKHGIRVLRFTNDDVMTNIEGCIEALMEYMEGMGPPPESTPGPTPSGSL